MNIDNINRVIEAIRAEPHHFVMRDWNTAGNHNLPEERKTLAKNNPCNTAGCIGGWMDSLALWDIADGKMQLPAPQYEGENVIKNALAIAGAFVGVPHYDLDDLFHMDRRFSMWRFDKLPPAKRAEAGVRALEIFRDSNGVSDWKKALSETGLLEYMNGESVAIDGRTYY